MEKVKFNDWLDFGIYPTKSDMYAEFLCFQFNDISRHNTRIIKIKGRYTNNPFCDEIGVVYKMDIGRRWIDAFVPEEYILAWKNG